jgi:DNA-binding transcriptional MerR regulator
MAKVSITAAAKLAGVSRSTLYRSYINKGLLSLSRDQQNKPCIDTSELLRVFGALHAGTARDSQSDSVGQLNATASDSVGQPEKSTESHQATQALELKLLKEQLEASQAREMFYQQQIQNLTDTMKLLEDQRPNKRPPHRRWWQFMWK